jgi:two-component system chemotaxis response regulator CheY
MVGSTLRLAGYHVLEGENGQDALDRINALTEGKVDLIITDLNMPVMDGFTFIRAVRGATQQRFTPILILTTESRDGLKAEGKAAGATGWIVKPFLPSQLIKVIEKVLPS